MPSEVWSDNHTEWPRTSVAQNGAVSKPPPYWSTPLPDCTAVDRNSFASFKGSMLLAPWGRCLPNDSEALNEKLYIRNEGGYIRIYNCSNSLDPDCENLFLLYYLDKGRKVYGDIIVYVLMTEVNAKGRTQIFKAQQIRFEELWQERQLDSRKRLK